MVVYTVQCKDFCLLVVDEVVFCSFSSWVCVCRDTRTVLVCVCRDTQMVLVCACRDTQTVLTMKVSACRSTQTVLAMELLKVF